MRLERLPNLAPAQLRLLHAVHEYWRRERRFPRVAALSVPLRKELDVREVLETMPSGLILRRGPGSDVEVLKLDMLGLALCPGEGRSVEAFLALLRDAAQQALASHEAKPVVTRTQLRSLLQDLPQADFDLVAPVIWDSLPGGGSQTESEWTREPWLDVIRYEHVQSMNEFLAAAAVEAKEAAVLEPEHVSLLAEVYRRWSTEGVWPSSRDFVAAYRPNGDALRLLAEIPPRFLKRAEWRSLESKPVILTLDGMAFTERADADLRVLVAMIHVLVRQLEACPEDAHMTLEELARTVAVPEPVATRIARVMADEHALGVDLDERVTPMIGNSSPRPAPHHGARGGRSLLRRREDVGAKRDLSVAEVA